MRKNQRSLAMILFQGLLKLPDKGNKPLIKIDKNHIQH